MKKLLLLAGMLSVAPLMAAPGFHADVVPILREYCAGCHVGAEADGEFSVETYRAILRGGEEGPVIDPGKPEASRLLRLVMGAEKPKMPPKREPQLPPTALNTLRDWILAGAPGPAPEQDHSIVANLVVPIVAPGRGALAAITSVAFSPDGSKLAIGRYGVVELLDAKSREITGRLKDLPGKVNAVHFSKDGSRLIVASGVTGLRGVATLWRVRDARRLAEFGEGHTDVLFDAELSPDGKLLATAGYDQFVKIWNVSDGSLVRSLKAHNGAVFDLAFNRDGSILASASADETVKLWSVGTGLRLDTLNQPQGEQFSVAFTPDDRHVLSAGADNRIRMWRLISRKEPVINPVVHSRFAHEDDIVGLAVDPEGRWLVSSSADRSVKLWSLPDLVQRRMYANQPDVVAAIVAGPRGAGFLMARMDGSTERIEVALPKTTSSSDSKAVAVDDFVGEGTPKPVEIEESEPNDGPSDGRVVSLPAKISGKIGRAGDADLFAFDAKAGDEWMLEIDAARSKSPLDSKIEVLDADGRPITKLTLQALRDSWLTFRGKDSTTSGDFRLQNWREMELNEYLYVNGEVVKLFLYPRGPDSGFVVYPGYGARHNFFGTTAKAHPLGQTCYVVRPIVAGEELIPNGLPTFPVFHENDDESLRRWGHDSQLMFQVPTDGRYFARVTDVRGFGGDDFVYALTIRSRRPDFKVALKGMNPVVSPGSGKEFSIEVERIDQFDGEIRIDAVDLPDGFTASTPIVLEAGQFRAWGVINAAADAKAPGKAEIGRSRLIASATFGRQEIRREVGGFGGIKLGKAPSVTAEILPDGDSGRVVARPGHPLEFTIAPGETISARVRVTRGEFKGRIALGKEDAGRNLPHGVYVDNIGLNGLLIVENENERQFFITAAKGVGESTRSFHLVAAVDGNQATSPAILHVRHGRAREVK